MEMYTRCETPVPAATASNRLVPSTSVWRALRKGLEAQWTMVSTPLTAFSSPSPVIRSPLYVPGRPLRLRTLLPPPALHYFSPIQRRHATELLRVDDEADGPDFVPRHVYRGDAVGASVLEVA